MSAVRVLVMAGSSRRGAFSGRLAALAAAHARDAGAEVTVLDLRALALPVYDGDIEAASGPPEGAFRFRDACAAHDALIVVTPEYNGFPTPLLINAFDWLSRVPAADGAPQGLRSTAGKPVGVLASSPGALGGLRSLNTLRQYLQMSFGVLVVPQQFALAGAGAAFDEQGGLKDEKHRQAVQGVVAATLKLARSLESAA